MNLLFFERLEREIPIAGTENTLVQPHRISSQSKNDVRGHAPVEKGPINQSTRSPSFSHRRLAPISPVAFAPTFPIPAITCLFFFVRGRNRNLHRVMPDSLSRCISSRCQVQHACVLCSSLVYITMHSRLSSPQAAEIQNTWDARRR